MFSNGCRCCHLCLKWKGSEPTIVGGSEKDKFLSQVYCPFHSFFTPFHSLSLPFTPPSLPLHSLSLLTYINVIQVSHVTDQGCHHRPIQGAALGYGFIAPSFCLFLFLKIWLSIKSGFWTTRSLIRASGHARSVFVSAMFWMVNFCLRQEKNCEGMWNEKSCFFTKKNFILERKMHTFGRLCSVEGRGERDLQG